MQKKSKKQLSISAFVVLDLILLDQFTKYVAVIFLKDKPAVPLIENVFEFHYLENTSAAFGLDPLTLLHKIFRFQLFIDDPELFLNVRMGFFYILTFAVILLLCYIYAKIPATKRFVWLNAIMIFFTAGAIGNLIDRLIHQYVIDFLYFKLIDFPIFNVADIYVTVAAFALIGFGLFYYKDEDFENLITK